jgi:DeoR family glycerol-3-phosphate regulon repressor
MDNPSDKASMTRRHEEILSLLRRRGFVSIGGLASSFKVSEQTVRRDLKSLETLGLVTRYHGGAGLPQGNAQLVYENRRGRFAEEKRRIAQAVAAEIPENATVFIDIGTTMEAVAESLLDHRHLTVITNHLSVALILSRRPEFQILVAGGILRHNDYATTGDATRAFLERFRVGYGVFGIGAINHDGDLLDYDYRDIDVSTTAMKISRRKIIALDHSKFGAEGVTRVGSVADVDAIYTDRPPPAEIAAHLEQYGVRIHLA